jgi:hypothetical protein
MQQLAAGPLQVHAAPLAPVQVTQMAPPPVKVATVAPPTAPAPMQATPIAAPPAAKPATASTLPTPQVITPTQRPPAEAAVAVTAPMPPVPSTSPPVPLPPAAATAATATAPGATLPPGTSGTTPAPVRSITVTEPAPDGTIHVHIAAVPSRAAALTLWQNLVGMEPDLFNGRKPVVQETKDHGHPAWHLGIGGFQDVASAEQFCKQLRLRGPNCQVGL